MRKIRCVNYAHFQFGHICKLKGLLQAIQNTLIKHTLVKTQIKQLIALHTFSFLSTNIIYVYLQKAVIS